ncbi:hypothetical protein U5N28_15260 [Lysinibacillus telephonicus]|uniref:hypothetical protein n=1 Tax=Lysinibacillus telephonicus TaxID=1714840 RepID=UPI00397C47FE
MSIILGIFAIVVSGYLIFLACFLIFRLLISIINWIKWLRLAPYEKEREKKRKRRRNYNSNSSSSDSWWSFDSASSSSDSGGGDGGGGGD